jgi:hypothetical protein
VHRASPALVLILAAALQGPAGAQVSGANVLQNVLSAPAQTHDPTVNRAAGTHLPLTADALLGPPNPATMYALTGMNERQLAQYLAAYQAHMAGTWNTRVATVSASNMMERAMRNSDAGAARYYQLLTDHLWEKLRRQDQGFDIALAALLTPRQLESYRRWRAAWERGSRARQRIQEIGIEQAMLVR